MSEAVSESGSPRAAAAAHSVLASQEERQGLRMARFLMAAGTSLLVALALLVCSFLGLLPWRAAILGTSGIVALIAMFYVLFRTGANLRFADPSLTTEQVAAAILFLAYIMYHAGPARTAFTLFYLMALLFGVLRLTVRRMIVLALLALLAHAVILHLSYLRDPRMDTRAALTEFAVLAIVLPWFAVMGGYVNRLRVRLSDSHRDLSRAFERIGELAIHDDLTGTYNRRFLMEVLGRECARADRLGAPLSASLLDIDHFKSVNDTFGHPAGDTVLKHFTLVAAKSLRTADTFGRFGGEEFIVVMPDTPLPGAEAGAERMRAAVEALAFPGVPSEHRVTVTIGVAQRRKGEGVAALLARLDKALYDGKHAGRNRVISMV